MKESLQTLSPSSLESKSISANFERPLLDQGQVAEEIGRPRITAANPQWELKIPVPIKQCRPWPDVRRGTVNSLSLPSDMMSSRVTSPSVNIRKVFAIDDVCPSPIRVVIAASSAGSAIKSYLAFFPSKMYNPLP